MNERKGWKIFDKDLKCKGFQFEVGKTYKHEGEIKLCEAGFHFHKNANDLFTYNPFDKENRVCEISHGAKVIPGHDKSVASEITIIRELSWLEVLELVNVGDRNTGKWNVGDGNVGDGNAGNGNAGNENAGRGNAGNWNVGHENAGNWNDGHGNAGNWNDGYGNAGYLNTGTPPVRIFNKPTDVSRDDLHFPDFFYFNRTCRVCVAEMTDKEKSDHPPHVTTGGYLKSLNYKDAWRKSWDQADNKDRRKVFALPNWDNEIFKEISGIDVEKELGEEK